MKDFRKEYLLFKKLGESSRIYSTLIERSKADRFDEQALKSNIDLYEDALCSLNDIEVQGGMISLFYNLVIKDEKYSPRLKDIILNDDYPVDTKSLAITSLSIIYKNKKDNGIICYLFELLENKTYDLLKMSVFKAIFEIYGVADLEFINFGLEQILFFEDNEIFDKYIERYGNKLEEIRANCNCDIV